MIILTNLQFIIIVIGFGIMGYIVIRTLEWEFSTKLVELPNALPKSSGIKTAQEMKA
jgi:hypothetical protein